MNPHSTFTRPSKSVLAGFLVVAVAALAIGWTAGTVAASSGTRAISPAVVPSVAPKAAAANLSGVPVPSGGVTIGSGGGAVSGGGVVSGGAPASIAYPVPGFNSLGVAPQGTILAEGTATADMKADGSDKPAALQKASDAALADAHAQALAAAASMGVALQSVYSISIASNTSYTYPTPDCSIAPLAPGQNGATGSTGGVPVSPPVVCPQMEQATPASAQLVVTLIVAYKFA